MPRGKHTMPKGGRSKSVGVGSVAEKKALILPRNERIVCPICGAVWEGGTSIGLATSMESYIMQGYDPVACPDCEAAGRSVGFSGEFNFDGDGE